MNAQSPIVSEFATPEDAAAYEVWLKAKVAASLADVRPPVAHDEAIARVRKIIEAKRPGTAC
ncbi:MAG TPA: stability determinant [Novosphingobium sp.]|nr:stability determinant [Novosphingobium sp.]